jgi:nucleotide-binding universal stress UspA family protein
MLKILLGLVSENYDHPPVLIGKLIAQAVRSTVEVLIVVPEGGHWENAEAMKEQVASDFEEIDLEVFVKKGLAPDVYREFLDKRDYDLIILPPEHAGPLRRKKKIHPAVRKKEGLSILLSENPKPKLERILLPTACKEGDHSLVTAGARLAKALDANLTLLHVTSGNVPAMYTGLDQLEETVEELLQTDTPFAKHLRRGVSILNEHQVDSEVKIRRGVPLEEIIRETQIENYDLVVIGATEVNEDIRGRLMGNLTSQIVDEIQMPVLIVDDQLFPVGENG